jgi:hypothetical protein
MSASVTTLLYAHSQPLLAIAMLGVRRRCFLTPYAPCLPLTPKLALDPEEILLTLALKSVELIEEGGDVDNDTGTDERIALGVDETC